MVQSSIDQTGGADPAVVAGDLGYFTIPVADVERGKAFYGAVFGWRFEPEGSHVTNTTPPGGIHQFAGVTQPRVWFRVPDIAAAIERVRSLGGHAPEPQESKSGLSAECIDDQGTHFNLWQAAPGY